MMQRKKSKYIIIVALEMCDYRDYKAFCVAAHLFSIFCIGILPSAQYRLKSAWPKINVAKK